MARGLIFHYWPGASAIHRWDARCKLPGLMIVTLSLLHMSPTPLTVYSGLFIAAAVAARLPWKALLRNMKPWLLFLLVIFIVQACEFQPSASVGDFWPPFGRSGIQTAAISCWRLALMLCYALLFTAVTEPRQMQDALTWFLQPLPCIPARRVAMMLNLTIRLLPLILDQSEEVRTAIRSRLGDQSAKPFRRLKYLFLPLFRKSLLRSEDIAFALAARGYREDLPLRLPKIPRRHLAALALVVLAALAGAFGASLRPYMPI